MDLSNRMRPSSWDEVIGNEKIVKVLKTQIERNQLPQSILITGFSGTGKTSIARLIGTYIDAVVEEIDCGSEGSVDKIREIIESSQYSSLFSAKKLYVLDEAHVMSNSAQSALLKLLENTNTTSHFILLTDTPQKLKKTIRDRCVTYTTTLPTRKEIQTAVNRVLTTQSISIESKDGLFDRFVDQVGGSLRSVYSLMENVVVMADENGKVSAEDFQTITGVFGLEQEKLYENFPLSLVKKDTMKALEALKSSKSTGISPFMLMSSTYSYLKKVAVSKNPNYSLFPVLSDISKLLSTKDIDWNTFEYLVWEHTSK